MRLQFSLPLTSHFWAAFQKKSLAPDGASVEIGGKGLSFQNSKFTMQISLFFICILVPSTEIER